MNDSRSLRTILQDLRHIGLTDVILVTDRGYQCAPNLDLCILAGQSLVTAAKVRQGGILRRIREISDIDSLMPSDMVWIPGEHVFARQYDLQKTLKGRNGRTMHSDRLKLNLYFDPRRRSAEKADLLTAVSEQESELEQLKAANAVLPTERLRHFCYFHVTHNQETEQIESFSRNDKKINHVYETAGFFAVYTLGVNYSAQEALAGYRLRDEQEKYFYDMKTHLHADRQHNWTETGMRGVRFIEFVALIMVSHIKHVWRTSEILPRKFPMFMR